MAPGLHPSLALVDCERCRNFACVGGMRAVRLRDGVHHPSCELVRCALIRAVTCPCCSGLAWAAHHWPVKVEGRLHHPGCSLADSNMRVLSKLLRRGARRRKG